MRRACALRARIRTAAAAASARARAPPPPRAHALGLPLPIARRKPLHGPDCTGPCCKLQIIRTPRGTPTLRNAPVVFSAEDIDGDATPEPIVEAVPALFADDGIEEEEEQLAVDELLGAGFEAPTPTPAPTTVTSDYFRTPLRDAHAGRPRLQQLAAARPAPPPTPPPEVALRIKEPAPAAAPDARASFVVLDTETTGFGISDVVVQMAFAVFDADGRMLSSYNRIWLLPPRVTISRRAFKVHKISYGRVRREGLETAQQMRAVQSVLAQLQERGLPIVAHNAVFDARLLQQTAAAHGLRGFEWTLVASDLFCTMKRSRKILNLPARANPRHTKPPSNTELYRHTVQAAPRGRGGPAARRDQRLQADGALLRCGSEARMVVTRAWGACVVCWFKNKKKWTA